MDVLSALTLLHADMDKPGFAVWHGAASPAPPVRSVDFVQLNRTLESGSGLSDIDDELTRAILIVCGVLDELAAELSGQTATSGFDLPLFAAPLILVELDVDLFSDL